jgi:hypothetical protein
MGARELNEKGISDRRKAASAFYVYCIGEPAALAALLADQVPEAIEGEAALAAVASDQLAAVVSRVPLTDYGEAALQARLTDATWTAIRAMRHERVVEHFAKRATVVPLRFGAIYLRRASISRMLVERRAELQSILERLRGREEWGISLYRDQAKLMAAITSLSSRLREMSARADAATPGQGYLLRKEIEALRADEARAETRRVIAEIERELAAHSADAARLRVLKNEATEQGEVAARLAFLIARERYAAFHQAAEQLAQAIAASGFQLELTGPWPAYNFVGGLTLAEATK